MSEYVDRYENFRINNGISIIPYIEIPLLDSDKFIVYKNGKTRLDRISQTYYGNPYHGWLIMLANSEFGSMEFDIPDNSIIRIPFPFSVAILNYENSIKKYKELNE